MVNDQGTYLAHRNWVEEVANANIVTTAIDQGSLVVSNVKTTESDDVFRFVVSVGADEATVTIEFDSDKDIDAITTQFPRTEYTGVSESNPAFGDTDTLQYRLLNSSDAELWSSGFNPSGVVPGYMLHYARLNSTISARKLEATYRAPSRIATGFCDIGMIGAWPAIDPVCGFSYPAGFGWVPRAEVQRTFAGRLYTSRFEPWRRWALTFDALTNDESMIIDELYRHAGGARQVFARRGDLPAGKDAMLAFVSQSGDFGSRNADIRQTTMTLEEFI